MSRRAIISSAQPRGKGGGEESMEEGSPRRKYGGRFGGN